MQIRVYYEDTDCGGVVYHSNYLNFCERARSELFFKKTNHFRVKDVFYQYQAEINRNKII